MSAADLLTSYIPNGIMDWKLINNREETAMDNKELLLQCAKELFYAKGYDAVGVQEIVDRAGLTKPTLYYYFGSKLGILETLLKIKLEHYRKITADVLKPEYGIQETLYKIAGLYCDFFEQDRKFYMLMMSFVYFARENEAYQAVHPLVTEFFSMVVQSFEHAAPQLGNMRGRQRQFAIGFVGALNNYFLVHCEEDPENQKKISKRDMDELVNQFMYGIFS